MSRGWYSRKDVIQDLTTATGKNVCDLNEEFVIVGKDPPPYHIKAAEEEEQMQISALCGEQNISMESDICQPDLKGIQQMIRMVDEFYERPSDSRIDKVEQFHKITPNENRIDDKQTVTNTHVSITKFNPDVEEFVPKNAKASEEPPKKLDILSLNCIKEDIIKKQDKTDECDESDKIKDEKRLPLNLTDYMHCNSMKEVNNVDKSHSDSLGCIDISRLTPLEIKDMREKLKKKISGTSNAKCVKEKRERNLAIATLVRLHCQPPSTVNSENRIELKAPDYYQKSLSSYEKEPIKQTNISVDSKITKQAILYENLEPTVDSNRDQLCVVNETNATTSKGYDINVQKQSSQIETNPVKEMPYEMTKEVRESIVKVENWLNGPSLTQKGPSCYLGPVTFKRKVKSKTMSTISIDSENSEIHKSDSFVPSEFANQLSKKYMEHSKEMEQDKVHDNIWKKLESDLKDRDSKVKNKTRVIS